MKRPKSGSTLKQYAYATRRLAGKGESKKEMALLSGYSQKMADNVSQKIEKTDGYKNAIIVLAHKSNNLLLATITEFEQRGLTNFSNRELTAALSAISGAWDRIENRRAPNKLQTEEGNRLRGVFTRRTTTETAVIEPVSEVPQEWDFTDVEFTEQPDLDLDF